MTIAQMLKNLNKELESVRNTNYKLRAEIKNMESLIDEKNMEIKNLLDGKSTKNNVENDFLVEEYKKLEETNKKLQKDLILKNNEIDSLTEKLEDAIKSFEEIVNLDVIDESE